MWKVIDKLVIKSLCTNIHGSIYEQFNGRKNRSSFNLLIWDRCSDWSFPLLGSAIA